MSSSDPSKALLMLHFLKDLTIMLSGMALHAADNSRATCEGGWRKGADWNRELPFFRLRNRQKLVRIRFENIRYYPCSDKWRKNSFLIPYIQQHLNCVCVCVYCIVIPTQKKISLVPKFLNTRSNLTLR